MDNSTSYRLHSFFGSEPVTIDRKVNLRVDDTNGRIIAHATVIVRDRDGDPLHALSHLATGSLGEDAVDLSSWAEQGAMRELNDRLRTLDIEIVEESFAHAE